jgi:Domain of unknown function (DUF4304)
MKIKLEELLLSAERDLMIKSLKQIVIPSLRKQGFKGSFPHFYRQLDNQTDLLMFQFSVYGGVLYVEISKCSSEGYTEETSGILIPPNKIKVYQIGGGSPYNRTRIGKDSGNTFEFNEFNTEEVARKIFCALREAEEWWSLYPNWWNN